MKATQARIVGRPADIQFTHTPNFTPVYTAFEPRFQFKRAVKQFCRLNRLSEPEFSTTDKMSVAFYVAPVGEQVRIRIRWELAY